MRSLILVMTFFTFFSCLALCQENVKTEIKSDSTSNKSKSPYTRFYLIQTGGVSALISDNYYFILAELRPYLMYRINNHFNIGLFHGSSRTFSSHDELMLMNITGARLEARKQLKPRLLMHAGVEIRSTAIYSRTLPDQFNPDSNQVMNTRSFEQYNLPLALGIHYKINPKRDERMNIYFAPELHYILPLGYVYFPQSFSSFLLRFSFEFKK